MISLSGALWQTGWAPLSLLGPPLYLFVATWFYRKNDETESED